MQLLACRMDSRSSRSLDCSGMGWTLTGRLGPLGLSLQVIIIFKQRCSDRVPALLHALAQIGWAPAGLGRCSVQSANERLHTPSGVALTDVFSFSQEPPMLAPNHSRSTGTILIQLKTSVLLSNRPFFWTVSLISSLLICKSRRSQARPIVTSARVFLERERRCGAASPLANSGFSVC